ncbi:MAG TPA: NAD(P)H-hydrate dehydratase [Vicinamibacteria bacterium]|nr:NAD(P)H-hydrate dehydratase [Vicinamibacteria bacterium]
MHVLDSAAMREADRRTIEDIGLPGRVLMENAGRAIVQVMRERIEDLDERIIAIVCGKGNNGGDGLVCLRVLLESGCDARAFVLAPFESLSADAIDNLQTALKMGLPVTAVPTEDDWDQVFPRVATADLVVDAILGTGLSEGARGLARKAIEGLNEIDAPVVAVDVPSGLSSDSARIPGAAVAAELTVALAAPKICHYLPPACERCGHVETVDIGIPHGFLASRDPSLEIIEERALARLLPARPRSSHKGTFGHLLVVAGSVGKTGAAVMTARAALRSGAGLVTVASAASAIAMMAPMVPEVMWESLPETASGGIAFEAHRQLAKLIESRSALAIGPGLGLDGETVRLVAKLVETARKPTVVDADGINALAISGLIKMDGELALTPHPGEAGRLLQLSAGEVEQDRLLAVRQLATATNAHVLLKGFRTLSCDPVGNTKINLTGNAGMATAGTGDVLTGVVGGLLAQGIPLQDTLPLAAHVHGLAGDLAAGDRGELSMTAGDLMEKLPEAFRRLS